MTRSNAWAARRGSPKDRSLTVAAPQVQCVRERQSGSEFRDGLLTTTILIRWSAPDGMSRNLDEAFIAAVRAAEGVVRA